MSNFVFVFESDDFGTFQEDHAEYGCCAFVMTKGVRVGQLCGKIATYSGYLGCIVPACTTHSYKYECEMYRLINAYTQEQTREDQTARGYDVDPREQKKSSFKLEDIPKAIERSTECAVCLENENPLLLPCGHTTCFSCVTRLEKTECPMCRAEFKYELLRRL
jgi:hypothetical protein